MELTQLSYFRVVARLEHFTQASRELHITQPTLSKTIARLEDELGARLFDREGGGAHLNACGRAFLREVDEMFAHLEDGRARISELLDSESGEVSMAVTVPEMFSGYIEEYLLAHPRIHIHQHQCTAKRMERMLEDREIDFGFSIVPSGSLAVEWAPLVTDEIGVLAPENHPLASAKSARLAEFSGEHFLVNNSNDDLRRHFIDCCERAGFHPNIYFEGDQSALIGALAARGLGVAFGSRARYEELRRGQGSQPALVFVAISEPECVRVTGFAKPRGRELTPAAASFADYLRARLAARERRQLR